MSSCSIDRFAFVSSAPAGACRLAQKTCRGCGASFHEELPERGGSRRRRLRGLPVNDAARLRADSDAAKWTIPERQCELIRPITRRVVPRTCASVARSTRSRRRVPWDVTVMWSSTTAPSIWMAASPSQYAQHSWQGFSTGEWTRHAQSHHHSSQGSPGSTQRIAASDRATVVEYWIRNEDYLTLVTVVIDPVYLTELLVCTDQVDRAVIEPVVSRRSRSSRVARGAAPPAGHEHVPVRTRQCHGLPQFGGAAAPRRCIRTTCSSCTARSRLCDETRKSDRAGLNAASLRQRASPRKTIRGAACRATST
jgi:hypothetical protein